MSTDKLRLITAEEALPGRPTPIIDSSIDNVVLHRPLNLEPENENQLVAVFAMGCFWGVERLFWQQPGVLSTAVGYCGGYTPNPTYQEVCTARTGHTEAVRILYDQTVISYKNLLNLFWTSHDPTQYMRQKNDIGTQYRSAIFTTNDTHLHLAKESLSDYQTLLHANHFGSITTTIHPLTHFYYAEIEHQQYLYKNPGGYCSIGGLGVDCHPIT